MNWWTSGLLRHSPPSQTATPSVLNLHDSRTGVAEVVKLWLGQAEQPFTLSVDVCNCLLFTVPGASLASLTLFEKFGTDRQTNKQINRQTDSSVCRVASATKNKFY